MAWDLDFTGQTLEDVDNSAGWPPDGYYRVICDSAVEDDEDGAMIFTFKIADGLHKGRKVKERLNNPMMQTTDAAQRVSMDRAKIFAGRLGAVDKSAENKHATPQWERAVGKEFVIKIKTRNYKKKDGSDGQAHELEFAGIYPLDHKDLDGPTRASLGLPLLPGQSATERTTPKQAEKNAAKNAVPATPAAPAKTSEELAADIFG